MTSDQFEAYAKKYPELFEKSGDFELSIGDGWSTLVEGLFGIISYDIENAKSKLKYALENPESKFIKPIIELENDVKAAREALPTIDQVKEKFGGLRFYISGGNQATHNYIEFAELMSTKMCEECGSPGTRRSGGWVSTLCDAHYKEKHPDENGTLTAGRTNVLPARTKPVFPDE